MRVFSAAFIMFLLSALLLLGQLSPAYGLSPTLVTELMFVLLLLGFALQLEGLSLLKKAGKHRVKAPEPQEQAAAQEALQLLALLQEKGRFVDFIMEDISSFADAQVGAAARLVHSGCAEVLHHNFKISPLLAAAEGRQISVPEGFSPYRYRLLGKVGAPPYRGTVVHPGWHTAEISLPTVVAEKLQRLEGHYVLSPAEIELH